jgi:hypothetical protein
MAETEAHTETSVSKTIANILRAAREQSKQPKPKEVAKVVERIYPNKTKTPDVKRARVGRIIENAKQVVADAKTQGVHVSTGLHEWVGQNKLPILDKDPAQAFKIAKADLAVAIKASDLPEDNWVVRAASRVQNAESAQALAVIALASKEVRDNPNFIFQTAAQLAGSNFDPETQITTKAFVEELKILRGIDGFEMSDNGLEQALTEKGIGAMPAPGPDFDPARFSHLPRKAKGIITELNTNLAGAATAEERYRLLDSYKQFLENVDTSSYSAGQRAEFRWVMTRRDALEAAVAPSSAIKREHFITRYGIVPESAGDYSGRGLDMNIINMICEPPDEEGQTGFDKFVYLKIKQMCSGSREPRPANLWEESEYAEVKNLYTYLFGPEKAEAKLIELNQVWNNEYRRQSINWYFTRGSANAKDLITKYAENIPSDTLTHESKKVKWGAQAIVAYEQAHLEIATEQGFIWDRGRRWFEQPSATAPGHTRLEAYLNHELTGAEATQAIEWDKITAPGSGVEAKSAQYNEPAFNNLVNTHHLIDLAYMRAKQVDPALTEDAFYTTFTADPANTDIIASLRRNWQEVTLFDNPEDQLFVGSRLWNTDVLNKWEGFSPLQIRAMIKLEAILRNEGVQHLETKGWKLAAAISAAQRFEVGSFRAITLTHHLQNMLGLLTNTGGWDVMHALWQEQMGRHEDPDVFIRRFAMQTENYGMGVWSNHICDDLEKIDVRLDKGEHLLPSVNEHETYELMKARTMLLRSKDFYGSRYTEWQRKQLVGDFSALDDTAWRNEKAVWMELQGIYGENAKHVAHGVQLQLCRDEEHYGPHGTRGYINPGEVWNDIADRIPSVLLYHLSTEQTDAALDAAGFVTNGKLNSEWLKFTTVLSTAERRITREDGIINNAFSLGDRRKFNNVFNEQLFRACGITDRREMARLRGHYWDVISQFRHTFLHEGPGGGKRFIDIWAKNDMATTVTMVDFDPALAAWDKLPEDQTLRRAVSDATPHLALSEAQIKFFTHPELSLNPDEKEVIKGYHEMKSTANAYMSTERAEDIVLSIDDARLQFLEAKDFYKTIRMVPGMVSIFRALRDLDTGNEAKPIPRFFAKMIRPGLNFIANSPLFVHDPEERRVFREILKRPIDEWPKNFSQLAMSGPIGAVGRGGVAMDSLDVHRHLEEMETSGLIVKNHKRLNKMKDRHRVRFFGKFIDVTQRFWWIPLVATISVGVILATKDQEEANKK